MYRSDMATRIGGHTIRGKMAARARTIGLAAMIIFSDSRTSADLNLAATEIGPGRHPAQLMLRLGFQCASPRQSRTLLPPILQLPETLGGQESQESTQNLLTKTSVTDYLFAIAVHVSMIDQNFKKNTRGDETLDKDHHHQERIIQSLRVSRPHIG
jgi:hypothetical protein